MRGWRQNPPSCQGLIEVQVNAWRQPAPPYPSLLSSTHPRCNTRAGRTPKGGGLGARNRGVAAPLLLGLTPYGAVLTDSMLIKVLRFEFLAAAAAACTG